MTKALAPAMVLLSVVLSGKSAVAAEGAKALPFAVKVVGKGRPMILIPGLMCSGDVWETTVEHYKDKFECHVLTLAGFAGQPPIPGPFLEKVRQGIIDYIRDRKLVKPVVVGHSLGGYLAFALSAGEPGLVGPVVAVDGLPCLPAAFTDKLDTDQMKKQAELVRERMERSPREAYLAQCKALLKTWIKDKKKLEAAEKWAETSDQPTVARAMGELFGKDLRSDVGRIKSPVLLLGAWSKDLEGFGMSREVVAKRYEQQVAAIPRHKVTIAESANHFIMFDAPEWLFKEMDAFLDEK
jgi:pimeloyl-ACP methyl ester carboxylesterase